MSGDELLCYIIVTIGEWGTFFIVPKENKIARTAVVIMWILCMILLYLLFHGQ